VVMKQPGEVTRILGIESSCDETAAAVVEDGRRVLCSLVASQVELHRRFGGVVPEIACRRHLEEINPLIAAALEEARINPAELSAVAVTNGPGLAGALLVGVGAAKAFAAVHQLPLIGINHLEGHLYSGFLADSGLEFPFVALLVSGGHTTLVLAGGHGDYRELGATRDDAAGEAFDKIARALGLGYPGGPIIDHLAAQGDPGRLHFPRPWVGPDTLDFSFSGLKTAALQLLRKPEGASARVEDFCAGFQEAVVEVLVGKTMRAAESGGVNRVLIAGGVACNRRLARMMKEAGAARGIEVIQPPVELCTDNAAMVAAAAYFHYLREDFAPLSLDVHPRLPLAKC